MLRGAWQPVGDTGISIAAQVPIGASIAAASASGAKLNVEVLTQQATQALGLAGITLKLSRADGAATAATIAVRAPASVLAGMYGADYAARVVWATVAAAPGASAQSATAEKGSDATIVAVTATDSTLVLTATSTPTASHGTGTFATSPQSPGQLSGHPGQVSAPTGSFAYTYPMRVPPVPVGPSPDLSLNYDSGSVDGQTGSTNNQASAIGNGWDLGVGGFIGRSYVPCSQDGVTRSGDLCWQSDNATLSLAGHSGLLVKDSTSGVWKLQDDDGTRIERLNGASNSDNDGEYWKVTVPDGTEYFFGLNELPGWSTGHSTTGSTWFVPVFGDDAKEPCHGATFATSSCRQAWRWNLDYVRDPHGNSESFYYTPQTNRYTAYGAKMPTAYVTGGQLARIDYGKRSGTEYSVAAPARVVFDSANRCASPTTCDTAHPTNWPDTPLDRNCSTGTCPTLTAPTFWASKLISAVHTQILTGSTYADVDRWALAHTFPAPGDGTSPALWLSSLTHTGYSGAASIALPYVKFNGVALPNRVWAVDGLAPLDRYRISAIYTESGGAIVPTYSARQCSPTALPASAAANTMRCFPQWWNPGAAPAQPDRLDWFHKYVVTSVMNLPVTGGQGDTTAEETDYVYSGTPAWRYDDAPMLPAARRTWSEFAGYSQVEVRHGDHNVASSQQSSVYRYFQGLDGDRAAPGGGTKSVTITASDGSSVPDSRWLAGRVRERVDYDGVGGARVANTITTAWASAVTADNGTDQARMVRDADVLTRTARTSGGDRVTESVTSFDSAGRPASVNDLADTSTATDDRCTRTGYADNIAAWLRTYPGEVSVVGVACTATPSLPADAISDTRTYYDGSATLGAAPSLGNATRTDVVDSYAGATAHWQTTSTMGYDPLGRVLSSTDPRTSPARTTSVAYTPAGAGLTTRTVATNPLGWTTTTNFAPAWGLATTTVDRNGHTNEASYDALGRTKQVWSPLRPRASYPNVPSTSYAYTVSRTAPGAVATTALNASGSTTTSYTIYDGLGRVRQTQSPAEGGGAVVTDNSYDAAGRVAGTNNAYWITAGPSATLRIPTVTVPSSTRTLFDGAGRVTASILLGGTTERWRTSYGYGGDHVTTVPPTGGTTTTTYTDARGQVTLLQQWHGRAATGAVDTTTYGYDDRGDLTSMTDAAGSHWSWGFDALGRQTSAGDPDSGTTTTSYDSAGRVAGTTDARGVTLAFGYDALDRRTAEYSDSPAGTMLGSWTYDTLSKGQLTAATRYVGADQYVTAVTGYNAADQVTGTSTSIPAGAGALAGTYTSSATFNTDGSRHTQLLPAVAGLPARR